MKCKNCNGLGRTKATEFIGVDEGLRDVVILCPICGGKGEIELTEQEWLQTATTEQLAEEVYKLVWCSNELFQQMEWSCIDTKENDLKIVKEWLKQPHRKE